MNEWIVWWMNGLLCDVWVDICNCVCNVLYYILICVFVFQGQIKPLYGNKTPLKLRMCQLFIYTNPQHMFRFQAILPKATELTKHGFGINLGCMKRTKYDTAIFGESGISISYSIQRILVNDADPSSEMSWCDDAVTETEKSSVTVALIAILVQHILGGSRRRCFIPGNSSQTNPSTCPLLMSTPGTRRFFAEISHQLAPLQIKFHVIYHLSLK